MAQSPRHLLALVAAATVILTQPGSAHAQACPGAQQCPYTAAAIIGGGAGVLRFPEAVAVDPQGDVDVADQLSYTVYQFNAEGQLQRSWGSYGAGKGQFGPIGALATDAAGDVYVVDSSHNRIEKFTRTGEFVTQWGSKGTGLGQFRFGSSQNSSQPPGGGIAVTGGYVFVADTNNDRIERFNLEGGEPMQWGSAGYGPSQFSNPRGLAANESELVVADDDNHRIDRFGLGGEYENSAGSLGTGPGQFENPYGVALDAAGNVYVADNNNDRIDKFTAALTFTSAWGGEGSDPGQLDHPRALASDPAGDTYVADTANDRIEVFGASGNYLRSIGTSGRGPGMLSAPRAIATDPSGRLLVSDTTANRIELFAASGAYTESWPTAGQLLQGPAGEQKLGLSAPLGIAADPRGYVYVQNTGKQRLLRLWADGTYLSEFGYLSGVSYPDPGAMAIAPSSGDIYVADTQNNRVLVYSPEGSLIEKWGAGDGTGAAGSGPGQFDSPRGVAVDAQGEVYIADYSNNRIEKFSPSGVFLGQWGSSGTRDGHLRGPVGIAIDKQGRVYVVDYANNRVQVFDESGDFLDAWGVRGTGLGEFSQPTAVAVGCEGDIYVADTNNNRIERFATDSPEPTSCVPAGSWPGPLDVAPVLKVLLLHRGHVLARDGLGLAVSCQRGCKVLITATLSTRKPHRTAGLVAVSKGLPALQTSHLHLRIAASALRRMRAALRHHRGLIATITVIAEGPTGRRTTLHRTYAVTR